LGNVTPVVKWLLLVNVAVFIADMIFQSRLGFKPLERYGEFSIAGAIYGWRVWQFFTFQFLHAHVAHLLLNAIALYFFGPWMERWWGWGKFLVFYLLCGAGGAAFFTVLTFAGVLPDGIYSSLIGASAGIYGILAGVAVIAPHARVALLFPPIELSMRQMAIALLVISTGSIALKLGGNEGGEAGHLGGALVGFLLVRFPRILSWERGRDSKVEMIRPKAFSRKSEAKLRPRSTVDLQRTTEVDLILDKISRDGFQSLTEQERETLQQAAKSNSTQP
jgi:membrane associated rhomboid family serine protease